MVWTGFGQDSRKAARVYVHIAALRRPLALGVFERKLALDLVCDRLLDLGRKKNWTAGVRGKVGAVIRSLLVSGLETRSDKIVRQPKRGAWVDRVRREVTAVVSIPRIARPAPRIAHRRSPRVIRPPVEGRSVVAIRPITFQKNSTVRIPLIIGSIGAATIDVSPAGKLMTAIHERPLDITISPAIGDDPRVVHTLYHNSARTAREMDDRHIARVHFADAAVPSEAGLGAVMPPIDLYLAVGSPRDAGTNAGNVTSRSACFACFSALAGGVGSPGVAGRASYSSIAGRVCSGGIAG